MKHKRRIIPAEWSGRKLPDLVATGGLGRPGSSGENPDTPPAPDPHDHHRPRTDRAVPPAHRSTKRPGHGVRTPGVVPLQPRTGYTRGYTTPGGVPVCSW